MGEEGLNTNLASEYYVLSMLYRQGIDAQLTLGNKKSVDIIVQINDNKFLTIDVKGLKGTTSFPIDNCKNKEKTHFIVFVSFLNKINDCSCLPEVYIVPAKDLFKKWKVLVYENKKANRKVVQLGKLRKFSLKYKDNWDYFKK
jgi:hypothetical protein